MSVWMAIHPRSNGTRILATAGVQQTLLKAQLRTSPHHRRALPSLLEALALWEGSEVRAALVADERADTSGTNLFTDSFDLVESTPLYQLSIVGGVMRRSHRDGLRGLGDFRDLRRVLVEEVAR
jgi:hypothetical protein